MALKAIKLENWLRYKLKGSATKRCSGRLLKLWRNRKQRRKMKANLDYDPIYKQMEGWEY